MGLKPAGDPLAFYTYLKKIKPNAKCIWLYSKGSEQNFDFKDNNTSYVEVKSANLINAYLKSKIAISNGFFPYLYWKNRGSFYIETWHGTSIKYDLLDAMDDKIAVFFMKKYIRNTDLLILSDSIFENHCCHSSAMNYYKGPVLRCGALRQYLLNYDYSSDEEMLAVKNKIKNKKVILYCPTYRDYSEKLFQENTEDLIEKFKRSTLPKDFVLCIRLHHLSKFKIDEDDSVIDLTNISNSELVVSLCDLCVSDYSSIIFDAISIHKKVLLLQFDLNEYIEKRNIYFKDFEKELGIPCCYDNDSLIKKIEEDLNNISENYNYEIYRSENSCETLYNYLKINKKI